MKYSYQGIEEFEGLIMESDTPREEWGYGTFITLTKPGEVGQVLKEIDGIPQWVDPQHN